MMLADNADTEMRRTGRNEALQPFNRSRPSYR